VRAILLSASVLVACGEAAIFTCSDAASCGASGRCEPNGSCSFPDETCPSGRRFGEHAPLDIAGHCVEEELAGTTSGDASTTATTATTATVDTGATPSEDSATPGETTLASTTDDDTSTTGRETTSSTSSVDGSSSTGAPPQPIVIGPMSIADDLDDGAIWPSLGRLAGAWLPSGETTAGLAYCGEYPVDRHYYAYFRFVLPQAIPDGATVLSATFAVDGHGTFLWDPMVHALRVWAQLDPDPVPVLGLENYPSSEHLTMASVRWPDAGGLAWDVMGSNVAPDLAPIVQTVVDSFGGLDEGAAIQLWIGADELGLEGREVGWIDASHPDREPARLELTVLRP
jgi:hypothetical protein